ncbi:MAG: hypothetical protein ACRC3Y_05230 [Romboutsia sp.]|uniref:hypothetical protein n=1 Tax=Romboutsia sp. TaxID=1965302 RepID=UPI003F40E8D5
MFLYILTNPSTTQIGIYKITKKQMAFELGYSQETINSLIDTFENKYKLIRYNLETRELGVKNWGKYNLDRGGKPMIDCIKKELKSVNDKSLISYVSEGIEKQEIKEIFDSYLKNDVSYNVSCENLGQEEEEKKEKEKEQEEYKKGIKNANKHTKDKYANSFEDEDGTIYQKPTKEQLQRVQEMLRD